MDRDKGIWITKDGRLVKIGDMTDGHLVNSVALFKKAVSQLPRPAISERSATIVLQHESCANELRAWAGLPAIEGLDLLTRVKSTKSLTICKWSGWPFGTYNKDKMRFGYDFSGYSMLGVCNGEMAQDAIESELFHDAQLSNEEWLERHTSCWELREEVIRRNVTYRVGASFFSYVDRYVAMT